MEDSRYLQCLAADYGDLRDAASAAELTASVPSCPGWTVADLVRHVTEVYLHKVTLMRTGEEPEEWPPPSLAAEAPLAALGRAYGALRAEFRTRGPGLSAPTWYGPDRSEEHTSELQSLRHLVCRLLLEKKHPKAASSSNNRTLHCCKHGIRNGTAGRCLRCWQSRIRPQSNYEACLRSAV